MKLNERQLRQIINEEVGSYEAMEVIELAKKASNLLRQAKKLLGYPSKSSGNLQTLKIVGSMVRDVERGVDALEAELLGAGDEY